MYLDGIFNFILLLRLLINGQANDIFFVVKNYLL